MNEKILVVDDEKEIADLLEVYLKNDNYIVHKYYNGIEALECIQKTEIDLAILDVMLPDIDGFRICQKIRENYYFPVIMLTAKIDDGDKIMGLTIGADDYITKPFNPLEVIARVKTQLRRYQKYNNPTKKQFFPKSEYDIKFLKIKYNRKIGSQNWLILIFLGLETLIIDYGAFRIYWNLKDKEYGYYALFIAIMMIIMSIIIIKIYEGLGEKAELETRNMVYQTQVEAYRVQISEREEAVKEFRLLKHDMKNHLIYMEELIRQKKDEEVCKYIDELLNSRGLSHQGIVNSGNILVDGLINYKIPYMKSLNIDFQAEIAIPFDLKWPEDNLCIIIRNLLDNAIEGTQKLKEEERQIYLEMMLKVDNLFILIKNPCMEQSLMKKGGHFLTTKNEEGHGMGLLSVKRAVEECQGSIYTNVENGIFQASVMLPRVENKTDQEEN